MVMDNLKVIQAYQMDIDGIGHVSPFEFDYAMLCRSNIEDRYDDLSLKEKKLLLDQDKRLLNNAQEYYADLKMLYGHRKEPLKHWWYHLDKIVSGELIVDLEKREVRVKNDNEYAATLTA